MSIVGENMNNEVNLNIWDVFPQISDNSQALSDEHNKLHLEMLRRISLEEHREMYRDSYIRMLISKSEGYLKYDDLYELQITSLYSIYFRYVLLDEKIPNKDFILVKEQISIFDSPETSEENTFSRTRASSK